MQRYDETTGDRTPSMMKCLAAIETFASGTLLSFVVVTILADVVWRYLLRSPMGWPEEIAVNLLVYLTFMGCAVLTRENSLLTVNAVLRLLPDSVERIIVLAFDVLAVMVLSVLLWGSINLIPIQARRQLVTVNISQSFPTWGVVYGCISMLLTLLTRIIRVLRMGTTWKSHRGVR